MEILQIFVLLKGRQMFMSTQVYYKKVCTFLESKFLLVAARIVQSDRLTVNSVVTDNTQVPSSDVITSLCGYLSISEA